MDDRVVMAALWEREGLFLREMPLAAIVAAAPGVIQSSHSLTFTLKAVGAARSTQVLLYVYGSAFLPHSTTEPLGIAPKLLDFLYAEIGHFIEALSILAPKHIAGLETLWERTTSVFHCYPYSAVRLFRDCSAREVFDALHALGYEYADQEWKIKESM